MAMTFSYEHLGMIKRVVASWTSDACGDAAGTTTALLSGEIVRGVTDPTDGPTDNYDITLTDTESVDLLGSSVSTLANRDTSNTEQAYFNLDDGAGNNIAAYPVIASTLTVTVANAGATKSGTLYLYLRGDIVGNV